MARLLMVRTKNNGQQLQMKSVNKWLVWLYKKRGWQVNRGQIL